MITIEKCRETHRDTHGNQPNGRLQGVQKKDLLQVERDKVRQGVEAPPAKDDNQKDGCHSGPWASEHAHWQEN